MDRDNTFDCINKLINFNRLIRSCTGTTCNKNKYEGRKPTKNRI
jgi:hypothetical protein